ncbi:hypothetical protein DY000_02011524 [Brassica cretica]|uniref:Uncharacterized protein n=1 Tax=Brassica cretica TaxID=69181 RepID=A0ABQ7D655_BRACR|nr:hypothetical protein DY000_02011524 [Brassica cretica]
MATVPVRPPPPPADLHLRRNVSSTMASRSPAMVAAPSAMVASARNLTAPSSWESWKPDKTAVATPLLLSDVIWPAAGMWII